MRRVIQWVVRNGPAINTLMVAVILTGGWAMLNLRKELFPQFALELVTVTVSYPGASPAEVEEGICQKIEEAIRSIEGIKTVTSTAREGLGTVIAELYTSVDDPQRAVNEVRSEVDQIPSFPLLAEDPDIKLVSIRNPAIRLAVHGGSPPPPGMAGEELRNWRAREDRQLREQAERVRDELLALPNVSLVEMLAVRDYQIDVEIPEQTLRQHGLTLRQVGDMVRRQNIELPAGEIKSASAEYLVRGKNKRLVGEEIAELPIVSRPDGTILRVSDLGIVRDAFTDDPKRSYVRFPAPLPDGELIRSPGSESILTEDQPVPAIVLMVQKTPSEDLLDIVDEVQGYVETAAMPPGYGLVAYDDQSVLVVDRLDTLAKNALQGLILVFVVLSLFLELRLAFWVSMGIPVAVAGAFLVLFGTGQTINMVSTFAFLLALGIVVDDAIVIGENVYRHRELGKSPVRAVIDGASEVATPVMASVATTVFAFMPMFFVSGVLGKVIVVMPIVVIAMLLSSLVESVIILPNHLSHVPEGHGEGAAAPTKRRRPLFSLLSPLRLIQHAARHAVDWVQQGVERGLWWFVDHIYTPLLDKVLRNPFLFVSGTLAVTIACFGLIAGGIVPFIVFPRFDANFLRASVQFPSGTPESVTDEVTRRMADAIARVHRETAERTGLPPVRTIVRTNGYVETGGNGPEAGTSTTGSNIGYVFVELVDGAQREISSDEVAAAWREAVGPIAGAEEVKFTAGDSGPSGKPVEFQLVGPDLAKLRAVAAACKARLADYKGVFDIGDNTQPGKPELQIRVRPEAEALGIDANELAQTVRSTFYGEEVMRLQRGRHEVKLMVRYPEPERRTLASLNEVRVRSPEVGEIPIEQVAQIDVQRGYSSINRIDQSRSITVTADLNEIETNARDIVRDLREDFLPALLADYPGVRVRWEGQEKEMQESVSSLMAGFVVAVFAMYVLLTAQFRSYLQPLFVLAIIPFGMVGAILGHWAMGLPLTLFSLFGLVALAGVVVNDSIVLIDFINARLHEGRPALEALREAGRQRFRPVLLTSLTTIAALVPLLTETSIQVQVLIPMATSLAFGLLGATIWVLYLVPTIYVIYAQYVVGIDPVTGRLNTAAAEDEEEREVEAAWRGESTLAGFAGSLTPTHASPDAPLG